MKKYLFILLFTSVVGIHNIFSQQLLNSILGKWNVKEYHNNRKSAANTGTVEFLQDGVFASKGTYFGTSKGLYRTDETRSVVLIDYGKTTEWKASLVNNVLRLDKIVKKQKVSTVYLILVREGKDENQQVVN